MDNNNLQIKQAIWAYFLLLLFEGALRKWFLPGLATPLLIIRDPLALWIVVAAARRDLLPYNGLVVTMLIVGILGTITAVIFGHGNLFVAIYGARMLLFHFPMIYVMGSILARTDVINIGKATVWITIPMTVLITLQFYSPQSAWVNHGIGDVEGTGFSGALNYFRPPATFSFNNGTTLFYSFAAPFVLYFWLAKEKFNKIILAIATGCLLLSIPLSISRGLFFQIALSVMFMVFVIIRKPEYLGKLVVAIIGICIISIPLSQTKFFQTATGAFTNRFEDANKNEGGMEGVLMDRYLGGLVAALGQAPDSPVTGYGLGMGTNVGSMLLSGQITFLIAEGEWGRVIGELGPFMGVAVILVRIILTWQLIAASYRKLSDGDLLPWMLLSFGLLIIAQGGWSQPTSLGFCIMIAGLMLACLNPKAANEQ
ncbi:hypothetical protein [Mucilaginibacter myungsuensis]|uniref:hypothetical protein n=1 Tax=Mucilaginibacter myungsuensis TaxID=649104 RepID=UPI001D15F38D|nr:hypothetical protein [Mucilaginibacter myungsuensis]MDN3600439.1 hypothetical protein [Mucilaginibacter myungsuensis]